MKKATKIVFSALILVALVFMFLPIASFNDDSANAANADIEKQESRVQSAQDKLDRYINGGKDEKTVEKQRTQLQKEQDKLNALIAEYAAKTTEENEGLSYALLPGKLPSELELDSTVINAYRLYNANFDLYYGCIYASVALLLITLALVWIPGDKRVSKCFTIASFTHLIAVILIIYTVLRLAAFPIQLPYSSAVIHPFVAAVLIACPIVALAMHITTVQNTKRSMIYIFCIFLSIMAIIPFWIMIVNATRSSQQIQESVSLIPSKFLSYNKNVLDTKDFDVWIGFRNSAIIAFGSTFLSIYFSALTAYGFKVYQFKGNKFLYAIVLAIIMIPGQVTGTGFYMFMYRLGLTNNFIPLIIPAIASASTVFFFRQYLEANFQISLVEAGRIDGAREFFIFNRIVIPIMVPAMATMGIMAVITSWNNYLTPLMILSSPNLKTLPMMVKELRGDIYRTEYGSIYLGLTLTALPLLIVYFCFSKYIIAGVAVGGVKE